VSISGWLIPGLTSRRIETVVELGPGQTFALGGLLSETSRAVSRKVPALGDIPVLGALFSSVDYQTSETELVVLVTPEMVAPLNPHQVTHVPGAKHVQPNDWELFALGRLEGEQPEDGASADDEVPAPKPAEAYAPAAAARLRGPIGPAGAGEGT
jgi:pilus assembly protein CpaC